MGESMEFLEGGKIFALLSQSFLPSEKYIKCITKFAKLFAL